MEDKISESEELTYPSFHKHSTHILSGTTGSGKTSWIFRFLRHRADMFTSPPPDKIIYFYSVWQDLYSDMENEFSHSIQFKRGVPSEGDLEKYSNKGKKQIIIILDDLMDSITKDSSMETLFTRGAHHLNITVFYINQNMFSQGRTSRTINLNTHVYIFFMNPRDNTQVRTLSRQVFPNTPKFLSSAYDDVMKTPYSYLILDLSPKTHADLRVRTNIFPGEQMTIYRPITP